MKRHSRPPFVLYLKKGLSMKELKNGFTRNQSNTSTEITHAKTKMTATELKIFYQTTTLINMQDTDFSEYSMNITDFCKAVNLNDTNRDFIVKTCKSLLRQVFEMEQENGDYIGYTIFKKMHYQHKAQKINFAFNDEMKPYLLQLQRNFTQIKEVKYIKDFESKYAIRIYAMLKDSRLINPLKIEVGKLIEILQLPKSYKDFGFIDKKVLQVAMQEINEKSDLKITKIEPTIKERKKIVEIAIHFKPKEPTKEAQKQTKKARENKEFKKYIGKEVLYFDKFFTLSRFFKVENSQIQFIAEYKEIDTMRETRLDFNSIDHIEKAIKNAKEKRNDMKLNPSKYQPIDRSEMLDNLFSKLAKKI